MGTQWQRERSRGLELVLGTVFLFSCGLFNSPSYARDGKKSQVSEHGSTQDKKGQKLEVEQERDKEHEKQQEDKKKEDRKKEDDAGSAGGSGSSGGGESGSGTGSNSYVVLGYNDLGMHCMNQDFERLCILPPFNNLHAQVIQRGKEPRIITQGVEVTYSIPSNTYSVGKTNFWEWEDKLFGVNLMPNIGLTGNGLQGKMTATGQNDWAATGIPVTPINDQLSLDPYPLSVIKVASAGKTLATTHAVVPVSWEISCNLCHPNVPAGTPVTGAQVEFDILRQHDFKHKTTLEKTAASGQPILCAACHADPALGTQGLPGVKSLSHAMHGSHASRVAPLTAMGKNACYACHPGFQTNCQRDIHFQKGIYCTECHGDMSAVANPARTPWVSQPTCGSCHKKRRPEFSFEEPGKLFKDSHGHGNVHCSACHGSPHAIGPAVTPQDNVQAIEHQGFAGTISKCTVCHTTTPRERFEHKRD